MKIAFIRDEFDPYGGGEKFTQLLMQRLAQGGAQIHIFARNWRNAYQDERRGQINFHKIKAPKSPSLLRHIFFMHNVGAAMKKIRFDLVQSNERIPGYAIYRAGDGVHAQWLEIRQKHAGFFKTASIMINPYHRLICLLEKRLFEDPSLLAVIANSNMVRKQIISRFNISGNRVHTIYNGVDLKRFSLENQKTLGMALRQSMGIEKDAPVILFLGSGFERKGVAGLIQAASLIKQPFWLWIAGKGKTRKYETLSRELGIAHRVKFLGPRKDAPAIYAAADIFAFPTLYDPFPSVVLEAMASGLPVITTRQCGAAEIIRPRKDGFIIESPAHIEQTASYLNLLLNAQVRARMSDNALKRARQFSIEAVIGEYELLYQRLAARQVR